MDEHKAAEEYQKGEIVRSLESIHDIKFLNQIRTILKCHIKKEGGAV